GSCPSRPKRSCHSRRWRSGWSKKTQPLHGSARLVRRVGGLRRVDASAGVSPQIAVAPDLPRASAERAGQPENLVAQADQSGGLRAWAGELNRATIRAIREKTKTFTREKLGLRPKPRDFQKAWPKAPEYGSFPDAAALTLIFCSRL